MSVGSCLSLGLGELHSGALWDHCPTEYLCWKERERCSRHLYQDQSDFFFLHVCTHSSLGLGMCSHGAPRYILRPELWGAKLLSSSLGRELFNFRFFTAASIYPGLDFSMFLFPRSQYHFWIAAEKCSLPPRFASKPAKCLSLQTGIYPKPFTTQSRVLTAPSVFSKLLMLLGWL